MLIELRQTKPDFNTNKITQNMGKTDHCQRAAPAADLKKMNGSDGVGDIDHHHRYSHPHHIERNGKLSSPSPPPSLPLPPSLTKSINVPSFRVGDAFGLFTPYLNDVFLAAQILRGKNDVRRTERCD